MVEWVIETQDLRKTFGKQSAVDGLTLRVPSGSIYGFLGKNGAGKTTTIELLLNIIKPSGGHASVFGIPVTDLARSTPLRKRIGFVSEDKGLYPYMTVEQIIRFTRSFFPGWRDDLERRYLELFSLPLMKKVGALSKGMGSKLMLLLAVARGADLLILDEPTDGLDPAAVEEVLRELVSLTSSNGTTIFFSSHQLPEVEQVAEHVCIIDRGKAVVARALDDLKAQYQRIQVVVDRELNEPVRWVDGVVKVRQEGRMLSLPLFFVMQAVTLAGAGIKTQAPFQVGRGMHGSMHFTLSLPVSRLRLLATRTGMGAAELFTAIFLGVGGLSLLLPRQFPEMTFPILDAVEYAITLSACLLACFCVSVVLATFLDDLWQVWGSFILLGAIRGLAAAVNIPENFDPFRALGSASPFITHRIPWGAVAVCVAWAAALWLVAARIVQTRDY